ncbi:MAG: hypothetical protein R3C44_02870 [Chloroflexota bacterium]
MLEQQSMHLTIFLPEQLLARETAIQDGYAEQLLRLSELQALHAALHDETRELAQLYDEAQQVL